VIRHTRAAKQDRLNIVDRKESPGMVRMDIDKYCKEWFCRIGVEQSWSIWEECG
jgi:hypothetical protein